MKHKFSIIYSWFVRILLFFFPNVPIIMRFRGWAYSLFMNECGKNFQVASDVYIGSLSRLIVGDDVYIAPSNVIIALDLTIEDEVIIGPNCVISAGNHQFDRKSFRFRKSSRGKVLIEKGSWVAGNCTIVSGSKLPAGSILAAGAVLNKPFNQERSIYAGVPAKLLKSIVTS